MSVPYSVSDPYPCNGDMCVDIKTGENTWIQMAEMVNELPLLYNMEIRKDDVWLLGYPKSGNTWASEMLWAIYHGTEEAEKTSHFERVCWPEMRAYNSIGVNHLPEEKRSSVEIIDYFTRTEEMKSPRIIRCHLPLALLSPKLLDTAKVIYLCRNLKDCATSFYTMLSGTGIMGDLTVETYMDEFMKDKGICHPPCEQIRESWEKRHHPNMYFLFYEDMKRDLPGVLRSVASFLGKSLTDEQIKKYTVHLSVANMRKNMNLNIENEFKRTNIMVEGSTFVRKGIVGDWKNHFSPELNERWNNWTSKKFAGTDFKFKE